MHLIHTFHAIYRKQKTTAHFLCPESRSSHLRRWMRWSLYCIVLPNHFPHCIYTTSSAQVDCRPSTIAKFMMSEKKNCIQKSTNFFYTLISSFEWILPGNDRIQGCLLHFLTQQIVWWVESHLQFATILFLTYIHKRVRDLGYEGVVCINLGYRLWKFLLYILGIVMAVDLHKYYFRYIVSYLVNIYIYFMFPEIKTA